MDEYIKREDAIKAIQNVREVMSESMIRHRDVPDCVKSLCEEVIDASKKMINRIPTADVVPKSEVAELLRLMFNDDCACNYNGNDEWLPEKCKFALTDCPMPQERLGCWMEFVEYGLAELKKKYTEGEKV